MVGEVETVQWVIHLGSSSVPIDVVYWTGTAVIAVFVLGACNAANLIDGLDGLLTGTTAIANAGLLFLALGLAIVDDGPRDAQRIILCLAVLGACLGFLPHNFNPATIFLGDCGSLLLGFSTIVIILMMGDTGKTQFVIAGLIIYALPMIDTVLAIVRVPDLEAALALINEHEFGNGTAIFTDNGGAARRFTHGVQAGMVGINVPIPVPMAFNSFGGWKRSLFGDLHVHGPDGVRFYTRLKTVTCRWLAGNRGGSDFSMPTMK